MSFAAPSIRRALMCATVLAFAAGPCRAERNRLLPFWGQPFPTGFTRGEIDAPGPGSGCVGTSRALRHHARRCLAVLHARG